MTLSGFERMQLIHVWKSFLCCRNKTLKNVFDCIITNALHPNSHKLPTELSHLLPLYYGRFHMEIERKGHPDSFQ
jgi:hypothetical protein